MNRFIKSILDLIISTSNATLEVPSLRPNYCHRTFQIIVFYILLYVKPRYVSFFHKSSKRVALAFLYCLSQEILLEDWWKLVRKDLSRFRIFYPREMFNMLSLKMFKIISKYCCIFNITPPVSWVVHRTRYFRRCYSFMSLVLCLDSQFIQNIVKWKFGTFFLVDHLPLTLYCQVVAWSSLVVVNITITNDNFG